MKNLFLICLLIPCVGFSQPLLEKIDSIINKKYNKGPAISVMVSQGFEPIYEKQKGYSNLELNVEANETTKFRIGSVTKQFTAIAILQLMEQGKIVLSDPIQNYLPDFPEKEHTIKVEHLLSHTSGLAEITEQEIFFTNLMKNGSHPDSLVKHFKNLPLNFEPGSQFSYCNSGYHLLGLIVERVSGVPYNEYIAKNLLQVAEMENTLADDNAMLIENRANGYEELFQNIQNATYIDMSIPFSAGNLLSNPIDLNKWYKALFDFKLVSEKTLKLAHSKFQLNDGTFTHAGFGWFVDSLQGENLIYHEGGINGFLSSVWYVPAKQDLTVILSNCSCMPTVNTAKTISAIVIGKTLPAKQRIELAKETLEKYTGTYLMDGEEWSISLKEKDLYFQFSNGNGHAIYPISKNEFFAEEWPTQFFFYEKKGKIEFNFVYSEERIIGYKK
jgi:CubicO group peptidase (beta-lactamase class C family)